VSEQGTMPRTAAGRALLDDYREVVRKRPSVDGILSLHAILAIEAEAAQPAPGLDVEMLRHSIVQADIYLANGDFLKARDELEAMLARLWGGER
jgi:hypothetical protein